MNNYIAKGYAVKLSAEETAHMSECTWYLPHHSVINLNKARVRVLYDTATEFGGTSLNKRTAARTTAEQFSRWSSDLI